MRLLKQWCPIFVFIGIYMCTNFIGLMLLLFGPESYWQLSYEFTGITLPDVYMDDLARILLLAIGAPAFLVVGYGIGRVLLKRVKKTPCILPDKPRELFSTCAEAIFWILSGLAFYHLVSVVGIDSIKNWLVHNQSITMRRTIMAELSSVYFYIIYSMIPLCLAITVNRNSQEKRWVYLGAKFFVLIILNIYLFQKRPLINALLLMAFSMFIYYFLGRSPRITISKRSLLIMAFVAVGLYVSYACGINITTIGKMPKVPLPAAEQDLNSPSLKERTIRQDKVGKPFKKFKPERQTMFVTQFSFTGAMAFWGMLNRTAYSAIVYPIAFPAYLDYYPLDLGIGDMPDDAIVMYRIMYPQSPNGATSAPFFTTLYSQGGMQVAWIGSLLVGVCFALVWGGILRMQKPGIATAALGALELLFAVLMAMASGRDSLLSSYGVVWPVFGLLFAYGMYRLLFHRRRENGAGKRICMLVTSGVVNDSRVIREADLSSKSGYETLMVGRLEPELGEPDPDWKFFCHRIPIPRAANAGIAGKILERVRIGLAMTREAVAFRPDLIHCNDFDTLSFGYLAAVMCDSALIYDAHELWSENELAGRSAIGKRLVKRIEGVMARRCDGVISVSNAAGAWLQGQYGLKNLIVVTNCPMIGNVEQQPKSEHFELLCHGMFAPDRGYEELIDCAAMVAPYDIQVRLRGYGVRTQEYRDRAAATGQKNIFFSEKVPSDMVCSAASASHVGVALTRPVSKSYELTVSNKLFEYLAAGLPVILSDVPEHRMLNKHYHFGIILDEISPEALAEAAILLKEDQELYYRLRDNAVLASRELCFEKEGKKLISLYRTAIKKMEEQKYGTSFA